LLQIRDIKGLGVLVDGTCVSETVDKQGAPLTRPPDGASERSRDLAALAFALRARVEEDSRTVLMTWHRRSPEAASVADLRVQHDILRTTELSTFAIVEYLSDGQLQSEDQARVIAATGKAPLRDTIALAELTKLYLYWRDVTITVLTGEARALGLDAELVHEATVIVRGGSDGSIVRMAKQFDSERNRLQRELAIEQARLEHHAFHDALTGLPNRRLFFDRLSHALDLSHRHNSGIGLLFIDVDQFKSINDRLGHDFGDRVLAAIAERLVYSARDTDTVARLGGDEFVVLYEQLHDPHGEGVALAQRIADAFAEPMTVVDQRLRVSASIGLAIATGGGNPDALLRQADDAMYIAKRRGTGGHHVWSAP
jgi:diguanylate cyclase (GGDEF)-like protein